MVRHIVAWSFADNISDEQNRKNALKIKADLEGLSGVIEGLVSIRVIISPLETSTRNIILESVFDSKAALSGYQEHPSHKRAGVFINEVMKNKTCIDFEE